MGLVDIAKTPLVLWITMMAALDSSEDKFLFDLVSLIHTEDTCKFDPYSLIKAL